jgi:hypothetical protein
MTFRQAPSGGRSMDTEVMSKGSWSRLANVTYKQTR